MGLCNDEKYMNAKFLLLVFIFFIAVLIQNIIHRKMQIVKKYHIQKSDKVAFKTHNNM